MYHGIIEEYASACCISQEVNHLYFEGMIPLYLDNLNLSIEPGSRCICVAVVSRKALCKGKTNNVPIACAMIVQRADGSRWLPAPTPGLSLAVTRVVYRRACQRVLQYYNREVIVPHFRICGE